MQVFAGDRKNVVAPSSRWRESNVMNWLNDGAHCFHLCPFASILAVFEYENFTPGSWGGFITAGLKW